MSEEPVNIEQTIEQIAMQIVNSDLDDLSGLGKVCTLLEEIAKITKETQPASASLSEKLIEGIEKIILDEYGDIADPIDILSQGVAQLQRLQIAYQRNEQTMPGDPNLEQMLANLTGRSDFSLSPAAEKIDPPVTASEKISAPLPKTEEKMSSPVQVDPNIFSDFASEAQEHLESAESNLLSLENDPENSELLNAVFRSFHTIKGAAGFLNLEDVTRVAHTVEDLLDSARKGKLTFNSSILDVALSSIDLLGNLITNVQNQITNGGFVQARDVSDFLKKVSGQSNPTAQTEPHVETKPKETTSADPEAGNKRRDQLLVRVATEKLDQLVNMIGELVISQTQVSQNPKILAFQDQKLTQDIAQLNRNIRDLQEVAMSMRMIPIRTTFERMARMVRDLARKCGKQVNFHMSGEETELDKNMVEELVDPLTHMVRNAVDHGIELPDERKKQGKIEQGVVTLTACHKGGSVVIELRDDGKGLDHERIRKKAIERGLLGPEENLSEEQIYDLIFKPGFSTAEKVSDVSGRGVGMDVVRRGIEKLRGKVEINSVPSKGSTFSIHLPLTLAIIDGMVVSVGNERYIIPLTSIVRSMRPLQTEIFTIINEGEMVKVQGDLFPLIRLHKSFNVVPKSEKPWESLVILVESETGRFCLLVDDLVGIQQVVIKGLDEEFRHKKKLSGCTILGDGRVGLILDVNGLVQLTNNREKSILQEESTPKPELVAV